MASSSKKTWVVQPSGGDPVEIEAERVVLDDARVRATFYDGEDVVASFTGFHAIYPVQKK
jgi:hypothetical protein